MKIGEMVQPVVIGLVAGAAATAFVGFYWAGWVTTGKANEMAAQRSTVAVAEVMVPYCVAAALADPNYETLFATMKTGTSYDRTQIVSRAGWATPIGATTPNAALASSCQTKLTEAL